MKLPRVLGSAVLSVAFVSSAARAHEVVTFEESVKPILQASCGGTQCHINQEMSGVNLTSYQTVMTSIGTEYKGPIVVAGDPDASPLIDKLAGAPPRIGARMPNNQPRLPDEDIETVRRWIAEGAMRSHRPTRGDANSDDRLNVTDAVFILNLLFAGGVEARCDVLVDANSDQGRNLTDAVFVLNFLFTGGPGPASLTDEETEACEAAGELSFASIYEKVFRASCAFTSCHSTEEHKGELTLGSLDEAYAQLVGVEPFNTAALAAGYSLVDPGKPETSFLLKKLISPGPGEGNRMPASSSRPLPDGMIAGIREWIRAGAPREGTIAGVPDITDELPPPIDRIPAPPVPENGIQLHLEPFPVGPRSEREIFFFLSQPLAHLPSDVLVERIDIHMSDDSHHFILYEWIGSSPPPAGLRPLQGVVDILGSHRFICGAQQAFFSFAFPPGVGLKVSKNASFDLNSHFLNLHGTETLMAEVYINIFFAEPGSVTTLVKPLFDINPFINVPPNQTRTTKWAFPGLSSSQLDPAVGSNGKVTSETHVYALSSHMHRHGVRFNAFLTNQGRDVDPPRMVYDNLNWDDPVYTVFDPPLVLQPGQGIRFETTHTYDDPPSQSAPPLTFGETSEDEMAILLGFYAVK